MYEYIIKILPKRLVRDYQRLLTHAGKERAQLRFIGFAYLFGIVIGIALVPVFSMFFHWAPISLVLGAIIVFALLECVIYARLMLRADARSRKVEAVLPDALQLIAINLRAGLTVDKALLNSARREFGPLQEQIAYAGKQIVAGRPVKDAFLSIPQKIRSDTLKRNVDVIIEGMESGGELADLLQETAEDLRNARVIEAEVKSVVLTYAIFIFFAAAIGAPLIFGVSTYLVDTMTTKTADVSLTDIISSESVNTGISVTRSVSIDTGFLRMYAIASLMITSFFSALIIGMIKEGNEKRGLKYVPLMMALSLIIFFGTRWFVARTFQI